LLVLPFFSSRRKRRKVSSAAVLTRRKREEKGEVELTCFLFGRKKRSMKIANLSRTGGKERRKGRLDAFEIVSLNEGGEGGGRSRTRQRKGGEGFARFFLRGGGGIPFFF